jgi:hypothetical protein
VRNAVCCFENENGNLSSTLIRFFLFKINWIYEWIMRNIGHLFSWVSSELLRASEGTLSRWSRPYLQSLAPTNPHWACMVAYGPFFLWEIHKEGLCPNSGDINRLMMIMKLWKRYYLKYIVTCRWSNLEFVLNLIFSSFFSTYIFLRRNSRGLREW